MILFFLHLHLHYIQLIDYKALYAARIYVLFSDPNPGNVLATNILMIYDAQTSKCLSKITKVFN